MMLKDRHKSERGEVICSEEKDKFYSTMDGEVSTKDDVLKEKETKLRPTRIYKLRWDRLETLKKNLNDKFEEIQLNWNPLEYGFDVQLFTIAKESKCNLVHVMKNFITNNEEYVKTYTRETFILIAVNCDVSLKGAFAICTSAGYHKVLPYVDTTFAYSVSKKILDPKSVAQLKCRFLDGQTISIEKLFHKDTRGSYLPNVTNDSFFIAEGFQAQIKPVSDSDLDFLSSSLSSIKVTRVSLKIMKSLCLSDMLSLLKELLNVHLSNDYEEAEEFEFLNYVKPVKSSDLRKKLDRLLQRFFLKDSKVNRNGFFICHKNYEEWVRCEEVKLLEKTEHGKVGIQSWEGRPYTSDIFDALGEEQRDWSTLQIMYQSKGKWRSDKFLNYIHGHVLYKRKYYFHIGKDWFKVDVEYIRRMDYAFFKLVQEKLLLVKDEGYLPLPWCSEKCSQFRINADHCITFCNDVLLKDLSEEDRTKIKAIFLPSDRKSEHVQLQAHEETKGLSSGHHGPNAEEENEPPLPASYEAVGENECTLSDDDDDHDDDDDDNGNSVQKGNKRSASPRQKRKKHAEENELPIPDSYEAVGENKGDDDNDDDDDDDDGNSVQKGKNVSASPRQKRRKYDSKKYKVSDSVKSQLSKVIGIVECKLCLKSLTSRDEEKYNKMYYILLNQFLEENPRSSLNKDLGVDPDNKFPTFLHGDRILSENVELFDILKITKNKVFLYHVKEGIGQKTRDAVSQIRVSASLISKARETNQTPIILGKWYEQVMNYNEKEEIRLKLKKDLEKRNCSKEEFLDLFLKRKIVYVYAFLDNTKGRKPCNELVSHEQRIVQKEDFYEALKVKSQESKKKLDVLCESLKSNTIIAEKDNGFSVEKRFLDLNTKELFQIFKDGGFSDRHADILFHTLQKHFVPTVSIKSHIAKFELIRMAHDFNSLFPDFELKFCQIRKP